MNLSCFFSRAFSSLNACSCSKKEVSTHSLYGSQHLSSAYHLAIFSADGGLGLLEVGNEGRLVVSSFR